uniref:Putative secreted protein n=1 Tax=Anopheles triannulatus TaxID=58253 RepID=A0A2M4B748_9DIPT
MLPRRLMTAGFLIAGRRVHGLRITAGEPRRPPRGLDSSVGPRTPECPTREKGYARGPHVHKSHPTFYADRGRAHERS